MSQQVFQMQGFCIQKNWFSYNLKTVLLILSDDKIFWVLAFFRSGLDFQLSFQHKIWKLIMIQIQHKIFSDQF